MAAVGMIFYTFNDPIFSIPVVNEIEKNVFPFLSRQEPLLQGDIVMCKVILLCNSYNSFLKDLG